MASDVGTRATARKWGAGTAAIVRELIAADAPRTQVALAQEVGVTQPRVSQVLEQLMNAHAASVSARGYRGNQARLLDLYALRARPQLLEPEASWYSTRTLAEQATRLVRAARDQNTAVACSADLGPDLLVPWRHPTVLVTYVSAPLELSDAGFVPAEGRADASVLVRVTSDATLLEPADTWPAIVEDIPLTDPVQQWWDLLDLGGEDRKEAADRLRRAIIDRSIASTT